MDSTTGFRGLTIDGEALTEREGELAELDRLLRATRAGSGNTAFIRGPAGIGKTRLLRELQARAESAGMTVLLARGGELERDFAFGCVRQLLEPALLAGEPRREELLDGAAGLAATVFASSPDGADAGPDPSFAVLHGLYWLTANLAERSPLLIALDDAHWGDPASLRYLSFLARRLEGVPALVAFTARPGVPGEAPEPLSLLAQDPAIAVLDLAPLSAEAVTSVVRGTLGGAEQQLCAHCLEVTGGNPFLLHELLRELSSGDREQIGALGPERVADSVEARLRHAGPHATELARAVAVLGQEAELAVAAALAGVDPDDAADIADGLAAADVLAPGHPLRFAHPILRNAVYNRIPAGARDRSHGQAAAILAKRGEPVDAVAVHLLATEPRGRQEVVDVLVEAGDRDAARGSLETAVRYLERALAEPPTTESRSEVLSALGRSAGLLGDPRALNWLREAVKIGGGTPAAVEAATWLCSAVAFAGGAGEAYALALRVLEQTDEESEHARRLRSVVLGLGQISPSVRQPVAEIVADNLVAALGGADLPPGLIANAAIECALTAGDSSQAASLATAAVAHGVVDDVAIDEPGPAFTLGTLIVTERFKTADRLAGEVLARSRTRGTVRYHAAALALRAWSQSRQGRLADVRSDADLYPEFPLLAVTDAMIAGPHIQALVHQGELERAAAVAAPVVAAEFDPSLTAVQRFHEGMAVLRLAQDDPDGALEYTQRVEAWEQGTNQPTGVWVPWRSQAALAHAALGDGERAAELASEQVELARRFDTPGMLGSALRVLGVVRSGDEGLALLREAVETLSRSDFRLEHARALIDLGGALRRAGLQREARDALREGLDHAHHCEAWALVAAARDELVAAGARPRRPDVRDVHALTPSERRVAAMAAEGISNKEIAQALYVTVNTVESHLRHVYRKLDIKSRSQLASRLPPEDRG